MAEEQPSYQHRVPKTVINVLSLAPGTRVRLVGDAIAEVIANPQDGVWLLLRYLAAPGNPDQIGAEEMVFAEDVLRKVEGQWKIARRQILLDQNVLLAKNLTVFF